jgi:hypothetical protein
VVSLRVSNFLAIFAQAVAEPVNVSTSSRSHAYWSVFCKRPDILPSVVSLLRVLSDGEETRSAGATPLFICESGFANSYHASTIKLWTFLEATNMVRLQPHLRNKEAVSQTLNDRFFELRFDSDFVFRARQFLTVSQGNTPTFVQWNANLARSFCVNSSLAALNTSSKALSSSYPMTGSSSPSLPCSVGVMMSAVVVD